MYLTRRLVMIMNRTFAGSLVAADGILSLRCLPPLTGHLDEEVAMSTMQEEQRSGPVLPPGRSRRSFPKEFKADAAALVLEEDRTIVSVARALGIGEIHASPDGTYGSPRVAAEPRSRGPRVNPKRVARLMRAHQIAGIRPRRPKRTATAARSAPRLPDLVGRRFAVDAPDRAWVSDITYVRPDQGWHSRWAVSGRPRTTPWPRRSSPGLKRELVHRHRYPDRATACQSIFAWLARYNTARRHPSIRCRTPDEYEAQYRHTSSDQPVITT